MDERVAVTGKPTGRLTNEMIKRGAFHLDCDLTNEESIKKALDIVKPTIIINAGAFTKVDESEKERLLAYDINAFGPNRLAKLFSGKIIQISTDYIFDGENTIELGYREDEIGNPVSGYGWTKYFGEVGLRAFMDRVMIIRTTILYEYNLNKPNFVMSVYQNLRNNKKVSVPEIYGNPTFVPHLGSQLTYAIDNFQPGILNLAGTDNITRYEIAQKIANKFGFNEKLISKGKPTGEAKRGIRSGLIMDKAIKLGYPMYNFEQGLEGFKLQMERYGQSKIS
jgi:dTDP-4-dehydrorhamnose reductase